MHFIIDATVLGTHLTLSYIPTDSEAKPTWYINDIDDICAFFWEKINHINKNKENEKNTNHELFPA